MATDGILYGVQDLIFKGKVIGYISDEGLTPAGDAPSKTKIWAAQKRDAPVKVLKTNPGTPAFKFTLIELKAQNLADVMGGTVNMQGVYTPAEDNIEISGEFRITFVSGETMVIPNASLTASFTNGINMNGVLGVACELEIMRPLDGGASFQIYPADITPPDPKDE